MAAGGEVANDRTTEVNRELYGPWRYKSLQAPRRGPRSPPKLKGSSKGKKSASPAAT